MSRALTTRAALAGVVTAAYNTPAKAAARALKIGPRFGSVTLAALGTGADDTAREVVVKAACSAAGYPYSRAPGVWYDGTTPSYAFPVDASITKVWPLGDSLTASVNCTWRAEAQALQRATRGDLTYLGHVISGEPPKHQLDQWAHSGVAGDKIEDINTRAAANGATAGVGTGAGVLCILLAGTNNLIAADSAATMIGKMTTLLATLRASFPSLRIAVVEPPIFGSAHAGYAALNAVRATYLPLLRALAAAQKCAYVAQPTMADDDFNGYNGVGGDGIHPLLGQKKTAGAIHLATVPLLAPPSGLTLPRRAMRRPSQGCVVNAASGTAYASVAAAGSAKTRPAGGTGSFFYAFRMYPTALATATNILVQYGDTLADNGVVWVENGTSSAVYLGPGGWIAGLNSTTDLPANARHFVVNAWNWCIIHGDATAQRLSIWTGALDTAGHIDMKLRQSIGGIAWNFAASKGLYLGYGAGWTAANVPGNYNQFLIGVGADVPSFAGMAPYAEAWANEDTPIPGCTAHYPMWEGGGLSCADILAGGTVLTLSAAATWSTAASPMIEW